MKTIVMTLPDDVAQKLSRHAAENGRTPEEWAARVVENAYDDDWLADLSPADRDAIRQGWDEAERGEAVPHEEVVAEFKQKFGW